MKANKALWILASILIASACSSSNSPRNERAEPAPTQEQVKAMQNEADKIIGQEMTKMQQREASNWPCSLFPQAELEALAGDPLDQGS